MKQFGFDFTVVSLLFVKIRILHLIFSECSDLFGGDSSGQADKNFPAECLVI